VIGFVMLLRRDRKETVPANAISREEDT
jgi:hypothetical protein